MTRRADTLPRVVRQWAQGKRDFASLDPILGSAFVVVHHSKAALSPEGGSQVTLAEGAPDGGRL